MRPQGPVGRSPFHGAPVGIAQAHLEHKKEGCAGPITTATTSGKQHPGSDMNAHRVQEHTHSAGVTKRIGQAHQKLVLEKGVTLVKVEAILPCLN